MVCRLAEFIKSIVCSHYCTLKRKMRNKSPKNANELKIKELYHNILIEMHIYIYTVHIHIYVNRIYYLKVYTYDTHYSCHFHQWWNQNPFVNIFLSNFVVEINTVWHGLTRPLDWQDSSVIYLLQFQIDICSSSAKVLRDSTLSAVESPDKDWRICRFVILSWHYECS